MPFHGFALVVNTAGTVGGGISIGPDNEGVQAAIFGGGKTQLVPPQPGELIAFVLAINDRDEALIESDDAFGRETFLIYSKGKSTRLDFGKNVRGPAFFGLRVFNEQGIIVGTENRGFVNDRAFRYDLHTGVSTLLQPLPTEPLSWGLGVNRRGDVLGYSYRNGPGHVERIGVWDQRGEFRSYFDEDNAEFPTVSDRLLFNDNGLIVITLTREVARNTSYLVPSPGVRLNLADLIENSPKPLDLRLMTDMNNDGSMIGSTNTSSTFLLERIGVRKR